MIIQKLMLGGAKRSLRGKRVDFSPGFFFDFSPGFFFPEKRTEH